MQFLVKAMDYKDDEAIKRRMAMREAHLAVSRSMKDEGKYLIAAAIFDDEEKMIGSVIVCEFESEEILRKCLENDPYSKGQVWETFEISRCKVADFFL